MAEKRRCPKGGTCVYPRDPEKAAKWRPPTAADECLKCGRRRRG